MISMMWTLSYFFLDDVLGNDNRKFIRGGKNFSLLAKDISVKDHHILVAKLQSSRGAFEDASIDLNGHISNSNGCMVNN